MRPLRVTEDAVDFAQRLADAMDPIVEQLGLNGATQTEGAALFAGLIARCNAKPGCEASVAQAAAYVVRRVAISDAVKGICRVCGCTDLDCSGCIERTGQPCHWVEPDLCSACIGPGGAVIENKACPFCGGKVDPHGWCQERGFPHDPGELVWGPECEDCGASAPDLETWNRRAGQVGAVPLNENGTKPSSDSSDYRSV